MGGDARGTDLIGDIAVNEERITSFEAADSETFGDILTVKPSAAPAKVGLLGCGYFEYWRMYPDLKATVEADLRKVYRRLSANFEVLYPGMVDTLDKAEAAGRAFAEARVGAVIVVEGTYLPDFMTLRALDHVRDVPVILFSTQAGADVSPRDDYEATLRNSALIGIAQLSGTFCKIRRKYEVVVGEIEDNAAYRKIGGLIRAHDIVVRLRSRTIGILGQVFRGMFDLEHDRAKIKGSLGPEVLTIQAEHLLDIWKEIPSEEVEETAERAFSRFAVKHVTMDDARRSCRLGLAMRKLVERYRLDALCFLGQHYVEKITGAPARLGASMLMEEDRLMVACEGDIGGLIMMHVVHELTGSMPLQAEWGQFDVKNNALFLLGHGIASPELATDAKAVMLTRSPEEWGFEGSGINYEMIVRPGAVTLGHFLDTADGWRMFISEGESISFPRLPCDEIHAMVRVKTPIRQYVANVLKNGVAHHVILVHGHIADQLAAVADYMGVTKLALV